MLSSPYIYVMGSHLDQWGMPHYLPCKTMFICWVHTMLGKYHIKKIPLDLVFKIDFENWTSYLVFFKEKPISNIQKGYQIHFYNISPVLRMSNI